MAFQGKFLEMGERGYLYSRTLKISESLRDMLEKTFEPLLEA